MCACFLQVLICNDGFEADLLLVHLYKAPSKVYAWVLPLMFIHSSSSWRLSFSMSV